MTESQVLGNGNLSSIYLNQTIYHFKISIIFDLQIESQMEKSNATIRLLFTRHGETEDNIKGMICGQQPGVLTKMGVQQAKKIGAYLKSHPIHFHHIYVSDLGRTVATFQNIKSQAKYLQKIPTVFTKLIREKNGGKLQGMPSATWKQMADKQKKQLRQYKSQNGESYADVYARCYEFLKLLIEQHIIKNTNFQDQPYIFAIAHAGVLMEFHNVVNMIAEKKEPIFKKTAQNCSFHQFLIEYPIDLKEFRLEDVKIKCTRQNFIDHLK